MSIKDNAVIPPKFFDSRFPGGVTESWSLVVDYTVACMQHNLEVDSETLMRFLLCYGFSSRLDMVNNEIASSAEDYIVNWHLMSWAARQLVRIFVQTTQTSMCPGATPFQGRNYTSSTGSSDGYIYHIMESRKGVKIYYQRTLSVRLGRSTSYGIETSLLNVFGEPLKSAMAVTFDRRLRRLLVLEPDGWQTPTRIHYFRLEYDTKTLTAYSEVQWPGHISRFPVTVNFQAAGGLAAILISYHRSIGNQLVFCEYMSPTRPARVYASIWTPISFLYRDESNILILERKPKPKRDEQILKMLNYEYTSAASTTTELVVPRALQDRMRDEEGNITSSVEFVPQVAIPVISTAVAGQVDRTEIGQFYTNYSASPIAIKFGAHGWNSETVVLHHQDLITGHPTPQIFVAKKGGDQHTMSGMRLVSWGADLDTEGIQIRVEDYTDGLRKCDLLNERVSATAGPNDANPMWSTRVTKDPDAVRSITSVAIDGIESMDVTEDGFVLWTREPAYDHDGSRLNNTEMVIVDMYGF